MPKQAHPQSPRRKQGVSALTHPKVKIPTSFKLIKEYNRITVTSWIERISQANHPSIPFQQKLAPERGIAYMITMIDIALPTCLRSENLCSIRHDGW
jgi:hypothetical protein